MAYCGNYNAHRIKENIQGDKMARTNAMFKAGFLDEKLKKITVDRDDEYSSLRQQIISNYPKIISLQESGVSRKAIYAGIMDGIDDEKRISEATFYAYLVAAKKEYLAQQKEKAKAKKAAGTSNGKAAGSTAEKIKVASPRQQTEHAPEELENLAELLEEPDAAKLAAGGRSLMDKAIESKNRQWK